MCERDNRGVNGDRQILREKSERDLAATSRELGETAAPARRLPRRTLWPGLLRRPPAAARQAGTRSSLERERALAMPGGLVLHSYQSENNRLAAQANEVAMANTRAQMARSGALNNMPPPDPNSQFMRKMKAATIERNIQAVEAQERADKNETARPYDRKKNYYELLGIDKEASAQEVRRAFRRLSLRYHPDKVAYKSDEEKAEAAALFGALKEAHEVLSHEATRREYDQMMGVRQRERTAAFFYALCLSVSLSYTDWALCTSGRRASRG